MLDKNITDIFSADTINWLTYVAIKLEINTFTVIIKHLYFG